MVLCVAAAVYGEWELYQQERQNAFEADWQIKHAHHQAEHAQKIASIKLMPRPGMIGPYKDTYQAWTKAPRDEEKYHLAQDRDGWWWLPNPPGYDAYHGQPEIDDRGNPVPTDVADIPSQLDD